MRALLCRCRCRLEAENDENLRELVRDNLRREHPAVAFNDERVKKVVADHSYRYEYVEVYASGSEPNEELAPQVRGANGDLGGDAGQGADGAPGGRR